MRVFIELFSSDILRSSPQKTHEKSERQFSILHRILFYSDRLNMLGAPYYCLSSHNTRADFGFVTWTVESLSTDTKRVSTIATNDFT